MTNLNFKQLDKLFRNDDFPKIENDSRGVRFLKLRSMSRKETMEEFCSLHNVDIEGIKSKDYFENELAKLHKRIADIRVDALHKLTHRLATEFDTIAIEDLNVKGMVRNRHLARSVSDAGFGEFRRQLEYKAAMTGASVFIVDRFYPSSKTCSACGEIHEMKLSNRVMVCSCGNVMDRDLNAAINLKNKAVSSTVTACGEGGSGRGGNTATKPASVKQEDLSTSC